MYCNILRAVKTKSQRHSNGQRKRADRNHRPMPLEGLEDRRLLSGGPTIYTVTDTSSLSNDPASLVSAINQANNNPNPAGSLIEFSKSVFSTPQTITLTSTLELFGSAGPITIAGPGANLLTVSGNKTVEVFEVDFETTAVLSGLTISDGTSSREGAGILNEGVLTILNSTIQDNTIAGDDGEGAGVYNDGVLTMSGSTITNNALSGDDGEGGGVVNFDMMSISNSTITSNTISGKDGEGGGVYNDNVVVISNSKIANNTVSGTDGEGGGTFNHGSMTVTNSTVDSNSVNGTGGGSYNEEIMTVSASTVAMNSASSEGGGIFNEEVLAIPNSTVADNSAGFEGGGIYTEDVLTAVNTTIVDNSVLQSAAAATGVGGGLFVETRTTANLNNTIVARNTFGSAPDDVDGTLSLTSSFNLIGLGGGGGLTNGVNGNLVGVANPGLGTLADNGGPTATIALLPGSPAVDTGSNALDGLPNDQRGPGLVRTFNGTIDIGAFEMQPATVTAVSVDWGSAGTAALQTAADGVRLLPAGRNTDLPWSGVNRLQVTFNEPETLTAAEVTVTSARGINYGPVTITGSGEVFTFTLSQPITKADRVTIVMAGAGIAPFIRRLDVLPGDVDDNGAVNKADVKGVRNASTGVAAATVFADVVGSGTVGASDIKAVKKFMGKALPKIRNVPKVAVGRAFARERQPLRHHHN
jgi:hypothetical protein